MPQYDLLNTSLSQLSGVVTPQSSSSASGTWTPASGTFNVAAGTVINVASVPSGAKMFFATPVTGTSVAQGSALGVTTSQGSAWVSAQGVTSNSYAYPGSANGISGGLLNGNTTNLYDGTYAVGGYFQINGGYLQYVTASGGSQSAATGNTIRWGVA